MARRKDGALSPKEERFVAEYLKDLNATQAYIRAGYAAKAANKNGPALLSRPRVAAAIQAAHQRQIERIEINADQVLRELALIAFADVAQACHDDGTLRPLSEMPASIRRTIVGLETAEVADLGTINRKVKFERKIPALELLGKYLGMWTERVEVTGPLTEEERAQRIAELMERARSRQGGA